MSDKVKRDQIVALKRAGVSNKDIVKQLKVCRKRFTTLGNDMNNQSGTTSSKPIPGRKRSVRTKTCDFCSEEAD